MDLNTIQGMNAYTANTQIANTASDQNNNKEATGVELNKESTQTVQEAFQVDITQQAIALQAENIEDLDKEDQEQQLTQQTWQAQHPQQLERWSGSIVDIFA